MGRSATCGSSKGTYLPDIGILITGAADQELVIWADARFDIEAGVLMSTES